MAKNSKQKTDDVHTLRSTEEERLPNEPPIRPPAEIYVGGMDPTKMTADTRVQYEDAVDEWLAFDASMRAANPAEFGEASSAASVEMQAQVDSVDPAVPAAIEGIFFDANVFPEVDEKLPDIKRHFRWLTEPMEPIEGWVALRSQTEASSLLKEALRAALEVSAREITWCITYEDVDRSVELNAPLGVGSAKHRASWQFLDEWIHAHQSRADAQSMGGVNEAMEKLLPTHAPSLSEVRRTIVLTFRGMSDGKRHVGSRAVDRLRAHGVLGYVSACASCRGWTDGVADSKEDTAPVIMIDGDNVMSVELEKGARSEPGARYKLFNAGSSDAGLLPSFAAILAQDERDADLHRH